jgi:hypothetical protein
LNILQEIADDEAHCVFEMVLEEVDFVLLNDLSTLQKKVTLGVFSYDW